MKKIIFVLTALLIFISCSSANVKSNMNMEEMSKKLENKKFYIMNEDLKKHNVSIEFNDGSIYGFSGVNRFFGSYKLEKDYLIVAGLGSTLKAGSMEDMDFEFYLLKLLQSSPEIQYKKDGFKLIDSKGRVIEFVEAMEIK